MRGNPAPTHNLFAFPTTLCSPYVPTNGAPASRDQEILGDLAERAYALACKQQDQALATEAANATVQARRARIETTLTRIIRSGNVGYRAQALCDDVRTRLDEEALFDAFLDEDVEDQVDRLCEALGLSPVQDQDKAGEDGNPVLSPSRSPAAVARPPGSWPPRHEAPTGDQRREDGYG